VPSHVSLQQTFNVSDPKIITRAKIIKIAGMIGSPYCVDTEDGQKVYEAIVPLLEDGDKVILSFEGVNLTITAFLNVAIGQLYGKFSEETLERLLLPPQNISPNDLELLKFAINGAKRYYKNPQLYDKLWDEFADEFLE
jgi:hypothetical protein